MSRRVFGVINDLNIKLQADELGVSVWQTPSFLFVLMGFINVVAMTATYFIARNYDSPEVMIISETVVSITIFLIGGYIIKGVEQIELANKMKSEFVSVASHQMRTPLSAIKWQLELLRKKFGQGLSVKQQELVATVENSNERMIRLVNDLLDVARIEQNRLELTREKVDVSKVVSKVVEELSPLAQAHNITLQFIKEGDKLLFMGDPQRVKLVIENLVSNSIKYSRDKGEVRVFLRNKGNRLAIEVRDTGVGIPEHQKKYIFEKFFRSDNVVKHQTEGTGLGLYIAKNIVEQSGGKMWFESEENKGSAFNFYLPAYQQQLTK